MSLFDLAHEQLVAGRGPREQDCRHDEHHGPFREFDRPGHVTDDSYRLLAIDVSKPVPRSMLLEV